MTSDRQNIESYILRDEDNLERQNEKLTRMIGALMRRVEAGDSQRDNAFAHFQTAAALEAQVRQRTLALEDALDALNKSRARAEELRADADQARRDLADAIEAIREGFALFDPEGKLVHANSRFAKMFPDIVESIKPGLELEKYITLVANSGEIVFGEGFSRQAWLEERLRIHAQPNQHFLVQLAGDRWLQVNEQRTNNNATTVMQTEVTDMVRLERMERRRLLDAQMELVRATLEHIDQGILIVDNKRLIAGSNSNIREHLTLPMEFFQSGYRVAAVIDEIAEQGLFKSTRDLFLLVDWMRSNKRAKTFRGALRRRDGRFFDVFAQVIPDEGFVISSTDVTNERRAAQALQESKELLEQRVAERTEELSIARDVAEQASLAKSRFLAATSHDLLQPINATKLFTQILGSTTLDARQSEIVGNISKAFSSVESMLNGLLDLSRLDSSHSISKQSVSLQEIFDILRVEFLPSAQSKGLSLKFRPTDLWVESDRDSLRRITQNLVGNALKYTAEGGVLVGTRLHGDEVFLEIYDTGPGLTQDEIDVMYNEFQRFQRARDTSDGMGLGLSIVQRSCALLGHDLSVRSFVGRGTKFRVGLKRAPAEELDTKPSQREDLNAEVFTNLMVLVIDNDQTILNAMEMTLEAWGATAILARSGKEALALLGELGMAADIALVDFELDAGPDGLDLIEQMRVKYPKMDSILITANRSENMLQRAKAMGVKINHKPIDIDALKSHLSKLNLR